MANVLVKLDELCAEALLLRRGFSHAWKCYAAGGMCCFESELMLRVRRT